MDLAQQKEHAQLIPQQKFLLDEEGTLLIDQIGRLESFETDFLSTLADLKLDKSIQMAHINRTDRRPIKEYYNDPQTVKMVANISPEDLKLPGYSFDQLIS